MVDLDDVVGGGFVVVPEWCGAEPNGFGFKEELPGIRCGKEGCGERFWNFKEQAEHHAEVHPNG